MRAFPNLSTNAALEELGKWAKSVTRYRKQDIVDIGQNNNLLNKFLSSLGISTNLTATANSISFTTATAKQVNTTSDAILYITCTTSTALTLAMGPDNAAGAVTLINAVSVALGMMTVRVPKGWYVKLTGTMADFTCNYVTC